MKSFKILSLIIFVVLAVVIGGLMFFVATFDANRYKQQIITLVDKQTGRDLTIDGDLKLAVYPDIAIEMGSTSLSNAAGFTGDKFATIGSAQVSVEVLPLLKKEIKVDEIKLNGLKLNLHRKKDGTTNWDDLAKAEENKTENKTETSEDEKPAEVIEEMLGNLSVAGVSLKDAHVHWKDDQSGQDITLSPLNLKTGSFKPGKPLPIDLSLVMNQKNPATTIAAEGTTTITLSADNKNFSLANLDLQSKITGAQIPNGALDAHVTGNIKGSTTQISIPDLQLQATLNGDLIPQGELKANLGGNLNFDVNAQLAKVSALKLNTTVNGKLLEGGNLEALLTGDGSFNLAGQQLTIPNLNLDAKLDGGFVKGGGATAKVSGNTRFDVAKQVLNISGMKLNANANGELLQGGKASSKVAGDLSVDLTQSQLKMPQMSMNTLLDGGLVPGGKLSQQAQGNVDLNWKNKQGGVNLSSLLVKLSDLELKGSQVKLQPLAEKPAISGQFQTNTFNLKQVLKTLGIEPPVTSNPKALSQVQAQFNLTGDTENADLQQLKVKLDSTSISGKLGIKNLTKPQILPELTIDRINVDDYLAPATEETKGSAAPATASSGNKELLPLETLRTLNINGGVTIGSMVINKLSLSNIKTRIKAQQGLINIDPANASLYKGNYKGRITLDARQATPSMNMRHELVGLRSEGLLFDLFQDKYISGDTKLITELNSRGNALDALLKNLNGTTSIAFKDGTIRDSKLAEKTSLAVRAFEKKEIQGDKSVVTFTGLSGDWKTTNGIFKTDNLSMLSPYFNITGTGTADVAKQVLDMKLRIGPNTKPGEKPLFAPLHIYGSFSDPKFKLDLKDLVKALAQQDLDKAKQKAKAELDQKKKELENRLAAEKAAKEQQLKQKVDDAKAKALDQVNKSIGDKLGDKLKQQLGGASANDEDNKDGETNTDAEKQPESVEDQVKDKLKSGLKGLF